MQFKSESLSRKRPNDSLDLSRISLNFFNRRLSLYKSNHIGQGLLEFNIKKNGRKLNDHLLTNILVNIIDFFVARALMFSGYTLGHSYSNQIM